MPPQQMKIDGEKPMGRKSMKGEAPKTDINASQIFGQLQKRTFQGRLEELRKNPLLAGPNFLLLLEILGVP